MIDIQDVLEIHAILIEEFGGSIGVRDEGLLRAAIERPFGGFGNDEFYPTPETKASAILESVVKNHPFIDGNKRTGYVLMRIVLLNYGKDIKATQDEKYDLVIRVASGQADFDDIIGWLKSRVVNR